MSAGAVAGPHGPDPRTLHPIPAAPRVAFLKPLIDHPQIDVGEYTYVDDPDGPEGWLDRAVLHLYPDTPDRLVIGRFCAIAAGVRFIMNGANHALDGLSTYPFEIFGEGWEDPRTDRKPAARGDTVIGDDVWIGDHATILPGVHIGSGAIVGASAVVGSDVPPYGVAVGNPAQTVKRRFSGETARRLLRVAWWDWPADKITRNLAAIRAGDVEALEAAA